MRIIDPRPIEELTESLVGSWKSVCKCTAQFLREVFEFDLRHGFRELGFSDTGEFLDFECGMSRVTAREKVRMAKRLVVLEKVEAAFARGELSYAKVRALTRVANPENEEELLAFAIKYSATHLERRFREIKNGSSRASSFWCASRACGAASVGLEAGGKPRRVQCRACQGGRGYRDAGA